VSADLPPLVDRRAPSAQTGGPSRLPKHKCADRQNRPDGPSAAGIEYTGSSETTRLATKPELELRDEVVTRDGDGDLRALSWAAATDEWRTWLAETREASAVFEAHDAESGEDREKVVPLENRFMESRQKQLYAKLKDVERGARREYGDALTTTMLTFTASTTSGAGDWERCPANHLDDLLASWSAVRRALSRALEGRDWEYVRMLEPHGSGHAHVHVALFVRGPVVAEQFEPVMEAHTENCLAAGWDAHDPDPDGDGAGAVRVERGVSNVGAYLSEYLMEWGEEAMEAPENVQRFNALLWSTGRRRWSASGGARSWASSPERGEPELAWELTHLEVRDQRHPIEDGGGEVMMRRLGDAAAGKDPPPVRT
jgi:hypothetical protein